MFINTGNVCFFQLVSEMQSEEGLKVYKKEDIPEKYHLKNNKKTQPILLVAKKGYYIKQACID